MTWLRENRTAILLGVAIVALWVAGSWVEGGLG